jgi:hypothetical protein
VTDKRILFGKFEFPRMRGLEYLLDEEKPVTDYLFVNEPNERFSMYFEEGFPRFTVPENSDREYCLFEIKRQRKKISFFCPEKKKNLDSVVWYFYVELFDENGEVHELPGQVRIRADESFVHMTRGKTRFIEILEGVRLHSAATPV